MDQGVCAGVWADGLDWSSISGAQFDFEIDVVKFVNRKESLNANTIFLERQYLGQPDWIDEYRRASSGHSLGEF